MTRAFATALGLSFLALGCVIEPNPSPATGGGEGFPDAVAAGADTSGGWPGVADAASGPGEDAGGAPSADAGPAEDSAPGWPDSDTGVGPLGGNGVIGKCARACSGKQCGPDGCGGTCGLCPGATSCQDGACVEVDGCRPECPSGAAPGAGDGCGGKCSGFERPPGPVGARARTGDRAPESVMMSRRSRGHPTGSEPQES